MITHRVSSDRHGEYEAWLDRIAPLCRASPGNLDWHIVRPIPGLTHTYTIIIRFDTEAHLRLWMESPTRARLITEVESLLVRGDEFHVTSGLDFWFVPQGARARIPVRWKQFVVTWSAIFPLALGVPLVVVPLLRRVGIPAIPVVTTLAVTGLVVFLMVYIVMPRYTRAVSGWLFR